MPSVELNLTSQTRSIHDTRNHSFASIHGMEMIAAVSKLAERGRFNPFTPKFKKYLLPTFYIEKCISDAMRIWQYNRFPSE